METNAHRRRTIFLTDGICTISHFVATLDTWLVFPQMGFAVENSSMLGDTHLISRPATETGGVVDSLSFQQERDVSAIVHAWQVHGSIVRMHSKKQSRIRLLVESGK